MVDKNQLMNMRRGCGLTQEEVAKSLGLSRPSYIDIEKNKKALTIPQVKILASLFKASFEYLVLMLANPPLSESDKDKFKQVVLNCIKFGGSDRDGCITKTKLAKIVYLAEFKWFYEELKPLTKAKYLKFKHGPLADIYLAVVDELVEEGLVQMQTKNQAILIALIKSDPPNDLLEKSELKTIKLVAKKWQPANTEQIVEFTHKQLPWLVCKDNDVIPRSLIVQEDSKNIC